MSKIDDGGPAFPFVKWRSPDGMVGIGTSDGMTLRDWFAGQALIGFGQRAHSIHDVGGYYAKAAYDWADAMIEERAKGGGK